METFSGRSSISTAVIRWTWKTHGREDMHFFLTQLLWLHRHSLLCPLPLTCMWTHCGQKMIADWLPWLASIPCAYACNVQTTALYTIYIPGLSFLLLFPLTSSLVLPGLSTVHGIHFQSWSTAASRHETLQYDYAHHKRTEVYQARQHHFQVVKYNISQDTNEDCTYTGSTIVH